MKMLNRSLLPLAASAAAAAPAMAQSASASVQLWVDTDNPGARIEPTVYGHFAEHLGRGGNMRPEYSADLHRRYGTFVKAPWGTEPTVKVATGADVDDYNFTDVLMRGRLAFDLPAKWIAVVVVEEGRC